MNRTTVIGNRVGVLFQSLLAHKTMVGMCKIYASIALIAPQRNSAGLMERPVGSAESGVAVPIAMRSPITGPRSRRWAQYAERITPFSCERRRRLNLAQHT